MNKTTLGLALAALGLGLAVPVEADEGKLQLEARAYKDSQGNRLPYRLLIPADFDPDLKYPLVVFLHGEGERGSDNSRHLAHGVADLACGPLSEKYPCFLVAPQCPAGQHWADAPADRGRDLLRLVALLVRDVEEQFPLIDRKRIYVTGVAMGATGTYELVRRFPELFAAAVPVGGGGDEAAAARLTRVPIWVVHGAKDKAVPVSRARQMVKALQKAGGHPKYTEYADAGHDAWDRASKNPHLYAWLFAQKSK